MHLCWTACFLARAVRSYVSCAVQAVAAREGLEQHLQGLQATLAASSAAGPANQASIAVASSPFAKAAQSGSHGILHEMQSKCAELKTENASLRAEVAELRNTAASRGIILGQSSPGVLLLRDTQCSGDHALRSRVSRVTLQGID